MAEEKESTSVSLSQAAEAVDPEDPAKSPPRQPHRRGLLLVQRLPGDPISGLHCTKRNCLRASCCGRTLCFISHKKSMGKAGAGSVITNVILPMEFLSS